MADLDELLDLAELSPEERDRLERKMISGREAGQVLASDVFRLAFVARRMSLHEQWEATEPAEHEKRDDIYHEVRALKKIEERWSNLRSEGLRAEKRLTEAEN
jgi:hypothetical protein